MTAKKTTKKMTAADRDRRAAELGLIHPGTPVAGAPGVLEVPFDSHVGGDCCICPVCFTPSKARK